MAITTMNGKKKTNNAKDDKAARPGGKLDLIFPDINGDIILRSAFIKPNTWHPKVRVQKEKGGEEKERKRGEAGKDNRVFPISLTSFYFNFTSNYVCMQASTNTPSYLYYMLPTGRGRYFILRRHWLSLVRVARGRDHAAQDIHRHLQVPIGRRLEQWGYCALLRQHSGFWRYFS